MQSINNAEDLGQVTQLLQLQFVDRKSSVMLQLHNLYRLIKVLHRKKAKSPINVEKQSYVNQCLVDIYRSLYRSISL